jgi:hypothetical protein
MITETQLEQLQVGDSLEYHGAQWRVMDYSRYTDPQGYETQEWLLRSGTQKDYYLLRETDPENVNKQVTWYLAEELNNPTITEPGSSRDLLAHLVEDMQSHRTPYPELQTFNRTRTYYFESQTEGTYESEGTTETRITWDYWDETHLWNLALEAWSNNTLIVYSTREVQLSDFSLTQRTESSAGFSSSSELLKRKERRSIQIIIAWAITIIGFFLMISGI